MSVADPSTDLPRQEPAEPVRAATSGVGRHFEVAILIVHYQQPDYLRDCLRSLLADLSNQADCHVRIIVVDNASLNFDALAWEQEFPGLVCVHLAENLGFAGGNNAGWERIEAFVPQVDFVALLNPDTLVEPGWLARLADVLRTDPSVAAVQPLITLHPETDLVNTWGNDCHFLGFGLLSGYRVPCSTAPDQDFEIASFSGAAVLLRADAVRRTGLFDSRYFLYLEDTELSWRLRLAGYRLVCCPASHIQHRYTFQAPWKRYGLLERNRWWMLLTHYRWRTLVLLAPALALMEVGQWLFAARHGLLRQRVRAVMELLDPAGWPAQRDARRRAQHIRKVSDRELSQPFVARFSREQLPGWLVQGVANPVFAAFWRLARTILWW